MKLEPFERWVGMDPVISYVGIRGDEDREGYISTKTNIQSIFPFRKNIWSEDVITKILDNDNRNKLAQCYSEVLQGSKLDRVVRIVFEALDYRDRSYEYNRHITQTKLARLLDHGVIDFNHAVFLFLKNTDYPLAAESDFPLLDNDDVLVKGDVFKLLADSGVGIPGYYKEVEFQVEEKRGSYARSRSGCYFCFFQQKIEWVWLYEQHPDLYQKAMKYENEKEGFTWNRDEALSDIIEPRRIEQIKREHIEKKKQVGAITSPHLLNILDGLDNTECTACFV